MKEKFIMDPISGQTTPRINNQETKTEKNSLETKTNDVSSKSLKELVPKSSSSKKLDSSRITQTASQELQFEVIGGEFWELEEKNKDNESGGNILKFTLKDQFNFFKNGEIDEEVQGNVHALMSKQFPAVEPNIQFFVSTLMTEEQLPSDLYYNFYNPSWSNPEASSFLLRLGYKIEIEGNRITLEIPDLQVLSHRWSEECKQDPTLPKLNMAYSSGIAENDDYIDLIATGAAPVDCIISTGKEFMHDQSHIIPTLSRMITMKDKYADDMKSLRESIKTRYDDLKEAKRSKTSLLNEEEYKLAGLSIGATLDFTLAISNPVSSRIQKGTDILSSFLKEDRESFEGFVNKFEINTEMCRDINQIWRIISSKA